MVKSERKTRLLVIAGPSCTGKSPLIKALYRHFPTLVSNLQPLILYNSRKPRPGEVHGVDYHFVSEETIGFMKKNPDNLVINIRGDLQLIDLKNLKKTLKEKDVLFEGSTFTGLTILNNDSLKKIPKNSIFISPFSKDDFDNMNGISAKKEYIREEMMKKLIHRAQKQLGHLVVNEQDDLEKRANSAYTELKEAFRFNHIIVNHNGEGHPNWDDHIFPSGEAGKATKALVDILLSGKSVMTEKWEEGVPL